jgi:peptide/nickel transport system permease protein
VKRQEIERQYGLKAAPWTQYAKWLTSICQGKFGFYISTTGEIIDAVDILFGRCLIGERCRLINTLLLSSATLAFTWVIGVILGIYLATHEGMLRVQLIAFGGYIGSGMPHFLLAFLLTVLGYKFFNVHWSAENYYSFLKYLPIYVVIIGMPNIPYVMRHMRSSLLDVLREDYIRTARSQGFSERFVVYRRALRNAANPLISMLGFSIPTLFEGTLVVAYLYRLPIVELQYWNAFGQRGQPYIVASALLLFSFLLLLGNFAADMLLLWSNPKIRYW